MQTFRPTEKEEIERLRFAAQTLKAANKDLAAAKKEADTAKEVLTGWLKSDRKVNLDDLKIGDILTIEGIAMVKIGKQNRFDETSFSMDDPETHAKYKKDFPTKQFSPLI